MNNKIAQQLLFGCKLIRNWSNKKKPALMAIFTIAISRKYTAYFQAFAKNKEHHSIVGFDLCSIISVFVPALSRLPWLEMPQ